MATTGPEPIDGRGAASAARSTVRRAPSDGWAHWKKHACTLVGVALFCGLYFCPPFPVAVDPRGESFPLSHEGKAALALFAMAATWWIFEVVPIGVTSIAVGVLQALFLIRPAKAAFGDFMDPSIWFIVGSITVGMAFSRSGLTHRLVYSALVLVGERTSMIYLGSFAITAGLTLIMAHAAVAATVYPLLMSIYALYAEDDKPTRFGKGLFIGMAFVAGAGSIMTLLGSARAAVAVGFFRGTIGREISFFEFTYYMLPVGAAMVLTVWALCMILFKPEKRSIPGLRDRAKMLHKRLGPIGRAEILSLVIVFLAVAAMGLQSLLPALQPVDKSAILLTATILFFVSGILTVRELEDVPWNIVLLFGGAMSLGFCLWETGAARWLAVECLLFFRHAHGALFVLAVALFVLILTNFVLNVAVIAVVLPVALVMAPYLGVAPEVVLFASLVAAGTPFLLLRGAVPNAIAYESRQFTSKTFLAAGIPASLLLLGVLALFVWFIWPLMGMAVAAR
jgi:sodium-dependent dicarboxylate transporter 2/3/5